MGDPPRTGGVKRDGGARQSPWVECLRPIEEQISLSSPQKKERGPAKSGEEEENAGQGPGKNRTGKKEKEGENRYFS